MRLLEPDSIIVWHHDGLCNRLNALVNAIYLKEVTGRPVYYYWPYRDWMKTSMGQLFRSPIPVLSDTEFKHYQSQFRYFPRLTKQDKELAVTFAEARPQQMLALCFPLVILEVPNLVIRQILKEIDWVPQIRAKFLLEQQRYQIDSTTVGVHFRGTDMNVSSGQIELILKLLAEEVGGGRKVLLCSEDEQFLALAEELYGDSLILTNRNEDRFSIHGTVTAAVDLLLLAASNLRCYSKISTYSWAALAMSSLPLEMMERFQCQHHLCLTSVPSTFDVEVYVNLHPELVHLTSKEAAERHYIDHGFRAFRAISVKEKNSMTKMKIHYGANGKYVDITAQALQISVKEGIVTLPTNDEDISAKYPDPAYGIVKHILVEDSYGGSKFYFNREEKRFAVAGRFLLPNAIGECKGRAWYAVYGNNTAPEAFVDSIRRCLSLKFGEMSETYDVQLMIARCLSPQAQVLELGGGIGRCSMVIATRLNDDRNLVVLECNKIVSKQLLYNRDANRFKFRVENAALSTRALIQKDGITCPGNGGEEEYAAVVKTVSYEVLEHTYALSFDTLVVDCDGALYQVVVDMPSILDKMKMVIMVNNYQELEQKALVDSVLTGKRFSVIYSVGGGVGPCSDRFYEVWVVRD